MGKREDTAAQKALQWEAETLDFLRRHRLYPVSGFEHSQKCSNCKWHIHADRGTTRVPHRKGKATSQKYFCCMGPELMRLDGRSIQKTIPANCPRYGVEPSYRAYRPKDLSSIPGVADILEPDNTFLWLRREYKDLLKERDNVALYWCIARKESLIEEKVGQHHLIPNYQYAAPVIEDGKLLIDTGGTIVLEERDIVIRQDGLTTNRWEYISGRLLNLSAFWELGIEDLPT